MALAGLCVCGHHTFVVYLSGLWRESAASAVRVSHTRRRWSVLGGCDAAPRADRRRHCGGQTVELTHDEGKRNVEPTYDVPHLQSEE